MATTIPGHVSHPDGEGDAVPPTTMTVVKVEQPLSPHDAALSKSGQGSRSKDGGQISFKSTLDMVEHMVLNNKEETIWNATSGALSDPYELDASDGSGEDEESDISEELSPPPHPVTTSSTGTAPPSSAPVSKPVVCLTSSTIAAHDSNQGKDLKPAVLTTVPTIAVRRSHKGKDLKPAVLTTVPTVAVQSSHQGKDLKPAVLTTVPTVAVQSSHQGEDSKPAATTVPIVAVQRSHQGKDMKPSATTVPIVAVQSNHQGKDMKSVTPPSSSGPLPVRVRSHEEKDTNPGVTASSTVAVQSICHHQGKELRRPPKDSHRPRPVTTQDAPPRKIRKYTTAAICQDEATHVEERKGTAVVVIGKRRNVHNPLVVGSPTTSGGNRNTHHTTPCSRRCSYKRCSTWAVGHVNQAEIGPEGWRCHRHQRHVCNVAHCGDVPTHAVRFCTHGDDFGPEGWRCAHHGGGTKCSISTCSAGAQGLCTTRDAFGEPGLRCVRHGGGIQCNVSGCEQAAQGVMREAKDQYGGPGVRCKDHRGAVKPLEHLVREHLEKKSKRKIKPIKATQPPSHNTQPPSTSVKKKRTSRRTSPGGGGYRLPKNAKCNIKDCPEAALGKKCVKDEFGRSGYRCGAHGGPTLCSVPTCGTQARGFVEVEDGYAPGWRCVHHNGGHSPKVVIVKKEPTTTKEGGGGGRRSRMGIALANGVKPSRPPVRCCIENCCRWGKKSVKEEDEYGPAGLRCRSHMGIKCNVEGCARLKRGRNVIRGDDFGPPGSRCATHGGI